VVDEDPNTPPGAQAVEDRLASALGVEHGAPMGAPGPRAWWRGLAPRTKRRLKIAAVASLAFVILVSVLLARFLQTENVERDADLAVIEAETRGDVRGMLSKLSGCAASPACVAQVRSNARNPRLLRHGHVKILQLESATAYALSGTTGSSRVAWTVIGQLPIVQCVRVRRSGNPISGIKVTLLSLSAPIPNEDDC
jgi:hypothetical protein